VLFDNLKFLALENNSIADFSGFVDSLKLLPKLERLSLSYNPISNLEGIQSGFNSLKFLMLESNKFSDF
jgi:Leucine-rich repeat (LRR) protein